MSIIGLLFLTREELVELTDLKIPRAQIRWLDKNNYPYEIGASGKPKVLKSYLIDRLNLQNTIKTTIQPNFEALG